MSIAILTPVLARPQNVTPFLESVKNTHSEHCVYFICSPGDRAEIKACKASDARVLIAPFKPGYADFAKKINWAFDQTGEEWVFQAADDIRFRDKWDIYALAVAEQRKVSVIGTNDLGNPLVKRGGHSTHTLFRRSYIEEHGGTIDNSGKVFSECYDHQYVDNEFIQIAIRRGVWAFSRNSIVEHLHPHWGRSEIDDTYQKAFKSSKEDRELYQQRSRLWGARTNSRRRAGRR